MKRYKLKEFELSQSYLFFWDKLEKANYFLEQVLDTTNEELDGRLVQALMHSPVGDGGQWDMVANLVEKYGLVSESLVHYAKSITRLCIVIIDHFVQQNMIHHLIVFAKDTLYRSFFSTEHMPSSVTVFVFGLPTDFQTAMLSVLKCHFEYGKYPPI